MADLPKTWNAAAHAMRDYAQPEDFGHEDCAVCEEARSRRAVRAAIEAQPSPDPGDVGVVEGAADERDEKLWDALDKAFRHVPLALYDEHRKPAEKAVAALVADREALLERIRELGEKLEHGVCHCESCSGGGS